MVGLTKAFGQSIKRRREESAQARAANLQIRKEARAAGLRERKKQAIAQAVSAERQKFQRPKRGQGIVNVLFGAGRAPSPRQPVRRQPVARQPLRRSPVRRQPVARQPLRRSPVRRQPVARQPKQDQLNMFGIPIN